MLSTPVPNCKKAWIVAYEWEKEKLLSFGVVIGPYYPERLLFDECWISPEAETLLRTAGKEFIYSFDEL